jgi:hypothetical protein
MIEGRPLPVRGYLSNDGVSMVRFQDNRNKYPDNLKHLLEKKRYTNRRETSVTPSKQLT